ncbi:hypothetical protein [Actinoallomurus sp. CA-142502]|uniref:hypothetical protein n=1 Tax=Actinoallomurus sp. CA-142502 TaxID=3239885 RepID=UPI003D8DB2CE
MFGFGLVFFVVLGASACGGDGGEKAAENTPPTTTAPRTSAATGPSADEKVVYHDALAGNDVTMKTFPAIIGAMPAKLTCEDILRGGKVLGNTYPNGEDFFLRSCKQVPRK